MTPKLISDPRKSMAHTQTGTVLDTKHKDVFNIVAKLPQHISQKNPLPFHKIPTDHQRGTGQKTGVCMFPEEEINTPVSLGLLAMVLNTLWRERWN